MAGQMERMKALMASYYAIQGDGGSGAAAVDTARDLDGAGFDAELYSRELLQEQTLPQLIAKEETLRSEVRSLDSSMQNLVYENYNKFLDAADTVRDMRSSVGDIEGKLAHLSEAMETLGSTADQLSRELEPSREKITQLVGVRGLLEKLEFLYDLPLRLRRAVELGAHGQAVRYYAAAASVLARHRDVPSLANIAGEARDIMVDLANTLRGAVDSYASGVRAGGRSAGLSSFGESLRLLHVLGEPADQLCAVFLETHAALLRNTMRAYLASEGWGSDPSAFMAGLNDRFVDPLVSTCEAYEEVFLSVHGGAGESDASGGVAAVHEDAKVVSSISSQAPEPTDGLPALPISRAPLVNMARSVAGAYFEAVVKVLSEWQGEGEGDAARQVAADRLQPVLGMLLTDMRAAAARLPELRLVGRASESVTAILRAHVQGAFAAVRTETAQALARLVGQQTLLRSSARTQEVKDLTPDLAPATPDVPAPAAAGSGEVEHEPAQPGVRQPPAPTQPHTPSTVGWRVLYGRSLRGGIQGVVVRSVQSMSGALRSSAPLATIGCSLLPDLAPAFTGLLAEQAVQCLLWLTGTLESVGDATHPALPGCEGVQLQVAGGGGGGGRVGADTAPTLRLRAQGTVQGLVLSTPTTLPIEWLLTFAHGCLLLAKDGIPTCLRALGEVLATVPGGGMGAAVHQPDIRSRAAAGAKRLTRAYILGVGGDLADTLRQGLLTGDWMDMPEPRGASLATRLALETLTHHREMTAGIIEAKTGLGPCLPAAADGGEACEADASAVLSALPLPTGQAARKLAAGLGGGALGKDSSGGADGGLHLGIEQLFAVAKSPALKALDLTLPAITACAARVAVDTLVEAVRDMTLGQGGYQQLQVDTATLFLVLGASMTGKAFTAAQVEARCRDVLVSAVDRCVDLQPLPPSVVYAVATEGLPRMRLR